MAQIKSPNLGNYDSFSAKHMANTSNVPVITSALANSVSKYRKEGLSREVDAGLYKDGGNGQSYNQIMKENSETELGRVIGVSGGGLKKYSQLGNSGTNHYGGHANTVKQLPEIYSPLWLNSNLNLPRDRATINAWCRSFFALNPFVNNAISLHSTYPISKLSIKCPNKDIEKFFNDMIEEIDLMNICVQIAQEYFLLGEAFVYADMDETKGKWSRLHLYNPDFMSVSRTTAGNEPVIMLRPDENLKNIITSNRSQDVEQRKQLPAYVVDNVRRGQNIPLDNMNVSHLARRIAPYEIRGTGLPVCIFRQLMLFDQLRESKYVQASSLINPITVVKIGSADFKPQYADLEVWRSTFEAAESDKNFKIFTHEAVDIQRIGAGQGIYDISGDITQLVKEIYVGLQVPQVLMDGGADTSYANGGVALDVLRQRYMGFRNMLSNWLKRKIFAPVSQLQEFYDYTDGKKQLIVPEIDWNHMSLFDTGDYINTLVNLTQGQGEQKRVSLSTLYRSLGLEPEDEIRKMRKENIQAAIFEKENESLKNMNLNALRTLDEENEIPEIDKQGQNVGSKDNAPAPTEPPLPGETGGLPDLGNLAPPPPPNNPPPV